MGIKYTANQSNFKNIPGNIIGYWLSARILEHLEKDERLDSFGKARQGLSTSDNARFLRFWHEVSFDRIGFNCVECQETNDYLRRWYPYNKAGNFRKWSAINEYVVNYQNDGVEIKQTVMRKYPYLKGPGFVVKNTELYFHHGITWNDVATGPFCCRYVPDGFIFADAGPMYFSDNDFVMLAYFNSKVFQIFADIICQGLHYSTGHIPQIPYKKVNDDTEKIIETLSAECLEISKNEWDSYETSWEFKRHPLI